VQNAWSLKTAAVAVAVEEDILDHGLIEASWGSLEAGSPS